MSIPKTNTADILEYLDGLTESQLLANSALIYAVENTTRTKDLVDMIRYNKTITVEQLTAEKAKIDKLLDSASPVTESVQCNNLNMFSTVVENAIRQKTDMKCIVHEHMIHFLENQMFDDWSDFKYDKDIVNDMTGDKVSDILQFEGCRNKITPKGICKLSQLICDPDSPFYDTDKCQEIKDELIKKLYCTMKYEMDHDEYKDLPIIHAIQHSKDYLKDVYRDFKDIEKRLDDLFDEIEDKLEEELEFYLKEEAIEAQFNPNPFSVYNLCPFPVGTRDVHRSMMKIAMAETDDELDEAVIEFARYQNAFNCIVSEASTDGPIAKVTRKAAQASGDANAKVRGAVGKTTQLKNDASKITEPWVKFIDELVEKMRDADEEERRNLIIKGGVVPKIIRWLKRGIGLVLVGSLGSVGATIAVIGALTMIAIDHRLDAKERTKILRELENELTIVEEKIDDSRGDENKQKKYELIRIRNKLKNDIARIKLRLRN